MESLTVKEVMKAAGLYKDGSKAELSREFIEEDTVEIGGKSYTVSRIAYWDAKIFTLELDGILQRQNPFIHDIYARNAVSIFDLVRMVNLNSKQGFKGMSGSGNELDLILLSQPRLLYDPDSSGNTRTTWERTIATVGSKNFFEGASTGTECTMAEEEGCIWLAMYNPALDPCVDAVKITMNTEPFNGQGLDFMEAQEYQGDPIIELKEPWTLPPEQSGEIETYYFQTGTDEMRALGVWVKMARNLRDITLNGLRSTSST